LSDESWRVDALAKKLSVFRPLVVSCGLGTNTLGLLGALKRLGVRPDAILFADTLAERDATYALIPKLNSWLKEAGFPLLTIVRIKKGLYQDCWDRQTFPAITFGLKSCSQRWKIRPQDNWTKVWPEACEAWEVGNKVYRLIGYDADEPERAQQPDDPAERAKYINVFPLEELDMGRDDCIAESDAAGLPRAGKSSCIFCSNMTPDEVLELNATEPHNAQKALALEDRALANLKRRKTLVGLGRKWNWRDLIEKRITREQAWALHSKNKMPCGCYDGPSAKQQQ
jgi:hypothetical protein